MNSMLGIILLADVLPAQTIPIIGGVGFIVFELIVIVCETLVLWQLEWGTWQRSLLDASLTNMTSGIIGLPLSLINFAALYRILPPAIFFPLWLFLSWALSFLIEGSMLLLLRRKPLRETAFASAVANAASYCVLILLFGVLRLWFSPR
ncbi:hypothetical protein [Oscillatoria sp. FACHB-1406]|uniref:hypothetical protein n=1 Tax=Oscillatoria sp. FACHB-1406 TaxID=2692846 RepID=UPI0016852775|nr:hypothetical protein [Oscillatoria sp. FACHB-1406]MBD2579682.1 hypothetical protein [Oscillatoria sp. FACHB-1406]